MFYVYLLQRESNPDQRYIGLTTDLKRRFTEHNAGKSAHTSKFLPWRLDVDEHHADPFSTKVGKDTPQHCSGLSRAERHRRAK